MDISIEQRIEQITETRSGGIDPAHGVMERGKVAALTASMEQHGWQGAPVVVDGESAVTGSHRLMAANEVWIDVPRVQLAEVCDLFGVDWAAHREDCGGDWHEAVVTVDQILPREVVDYLGLDMH